MASSSIVDPFSCATCGGEGSQRCAACVSVRYCGVACQRAHWPKHRAECRATVAGARTGIAGIAAAVGGAAAAAAAAAADARARSAAMSVRELRAALAARGVSAEGLLEKEDLVAALLAAPEPPAPRDAAGAPGGGGSGGGGGGGGGGGVAFAMPDGMGGMRMQHLGDEGQGTPLTRAELLELAGRRGNRSPTMGDALRYSTLLLRLSDNIGEGGDRGAALADAGRCLDFLKAAPAGAMQDTLLSRLLDNAGTTAGLRERWKAIMRNVTDHAQRNAGVTHG